MASPDMTLVYRARAGDGDAADALLSANAPQAYRVALHILGNEADAEEATQTALLKAFSALGSFDPHRPFAPWLLRIVAREALNLRRAERTRLIFWQRHAQIEEEEEDVEAIAITRARTRELWRAVRRLTAQDRLILTLTYFMGMDEGDVAVTLRIRRGTVKSRKHRALTRLRALLEDEFSWLRDAVLGLGELEAGLE